TARPCDRALASELLPVAAPVDGDEPSDDRPGSDHGAVRRKRAAEPYERLRVGSISQPAVRLATREHTAGEIHRRLAANDPDALSERGSRVARANRTEVYAKICGERFASLARCPCDADCRRSGHIT